MRRFMPIMAVLSMMLLIGCSTVRSVEPVWKTIPEIKQTKYEDAWAAIVGCVTGRNLNLEISDAGSGYLRTAYGGTGNNTQTRVIVRVVNRKPLQISLKAELIQLDMWAGQWLPVGNNVAMEKLILDELEARLK